MAEQTDGTREALLRLSEELQISPEELETLYNRINEKTPGGSRKKEHPKAAGGSGWAAVRGKSLNPQEVIPPPLSNDPAVNPSKTYKRDPRPLSLDPIKGLLPATGNYKPFPESVNNAQKNFEKLGNPKVDRVVLDGFMLLDSCGVEDPEEASMADVNGWGLAATSTIDLSFFTNLIYLDAGENNLTLKDLEELQSLRELHLHCNGLSNFTITAGTYQHLQTLNLSYNNLTVVSIFQISKLKDLRSLSLTSNGLTKLPDMSDFRKLEILTLSNNCFSSSDVFRSLRGTPNLKKLYIDNNQLKAVSDTAIAEGKNFAALEYLDLSNNLIEECAAILPCRFIKNLQYLILWGNPFLLLHRNMVELKQMADRPMDAIQLTMIIYKPEPAPKPSKLYWPKDPDTVEYTVQELPSTAGIGMPNTIIEEGVNDDGDGFFLTSVKSGTAPKQEEEEADLENMPHTAESYSMEAQSVTVGMRGPLWARDLEESTINPEVMLQQVEDSYLSDGSSDDEDELKLFGVNPDGTRKQNVEIPRVLNALRYALEHPPTYKTKVDPEGHCKSTALTRLREKKKKMYVPLKVKVARSQPNRVNRDMNTVEDVEFVLDNMKNKLSAVEANLGTALRKETGLIGMVNNVIKQTGMQQQ